MSEALTDSEVERLATRLSKNQNPGALSLEGVDGLFCALIASPAMVSPSQYLPVILGGEPDKSVTISLRQLMARTRLSCPTVIESLVKLEGLGLVVSTTHERGKVKTYYVPDPPAGVSA